MVYHPTGLYVMQHKYIQDLLQEAKLQDSNTTATPLPPGLKLLTTDDTELLSDPALYRSFVGRLLYLSFTRPDISYAVQHLSQFMQSPRQSHWKAMIHVLKYLKGCAYLGLYIPRNSALNLVAYCDADWAACQDTRRSLTGYMITKKQSTISRSSAEAEYRSIASTCDNNAARHLVENPVFHERTKHIEIDCHFVREQYKSGFVRPMYLPFGDQLADLFTKSLPLVPFQRLVSKLGLSLSPSAPTCGAGDENAIEAHDKMDLKPNRQILMKTNL